MHPLTLSKSSNVVEPRVEVVTATLVALQTASWLYLSLKHGDTLSCLRQKTGTHQATKATTYDHHTFQYSIFNL